MSEIKYYHTYLTHVKKRWLGKALIDVLSFEFASRTVEYYFEAIKLGVVTVNDMVVDPEFKLSDSDIIKHTVHIHEPLPPNIQILARTDDYIVVNKPHGIPCHPTGGYFKYSVTKALFEDEKVGCVNRLDMPVSGVLILTFKNASYIHSKLDTATKLYVAKVKGVFPDYIEVDKAIGVSGKIYDIDDNGKPSKTIFKLLKTDGMHSLVQCQPISGRTHQIRIHLKFLGFPIVNDILYGDYKLPEIKNDIDKKCSDICCENDLKSKFIISNCQGSNNRTFLIKDLYICLHAWKYVFDNKFYEAEWPNWTKLN